MLRLLVFLGITTNNLGNHLPGNYTGSLNSVTSVLLDDLGSIAGTRIIWNRRKTDAAINSNNSTTEKVSEQHGTGDTSARTKLSNMSMVMASGGFVAAGFLLFGAAIFIRRDSTRVGSMGQRRRNSRNTSGNNSKGSAAYDDGSGTSSSSEISVLDTKISNENRNQKRSIISTLFGIGSTSKPKKKEPRREKKSPTRRAYDIDIEENVEAARKDGSKIELFPKQVSFQATLPQLPRLDPTYGASYSYSAVAPGTKATGYTTSTVSGFWRSHDHAESTDLSPIK